VERESQWQRARQTAADFLRENPKNPRLVLVTVQDALTMLARGSLLRQESEVLPESAATFETAKTVLREATRSFEQIDGELSREIPLRHRRSAVPGDLSAEELIALQHHVRFYQAKSLKNLALCYPADSDDRIAMLSQAVEVLRQALTQIAVEDPLANSIRIDLAACYRPLGDFAGAQQALDTVLRGEPEPQVRLAAVAEAARIQLERQRPQQALTLFDQVNELAGSESAEFDFARLETYIALWRSARTDEDQEQADNWRKRSVAMVGRIEQIHGPYWGRRADLLLVHSIGGSAGSADVEVLARTADNMYRTGQLDEAVSAYDKAAEAALRTGGDQRAFELRYKAALVEHTRKNFERASVKLRNLGRELPKHEKASDAHLLAAWNAAQMARTEPSALAFYGDILAEHLANWPESRSSQTARLWLGRLREGQRDWESAVGAYQGVPRGVQEYDQALHGAARCWTSRLEAASSAQQPCQALAETAATFFEGQLADLLSNPSQAWTPLDRFCAEQAARIRLRYSDSGFAQSESVLRAALNASPSPEPDWQTSAVSLLVVALAGQDGKHEQAEQTLLRLGSESPQQLLAISSALAAIGESASESSKRNLANLQLTVAEKLAAGRPGFDAATLQTFDRVRAESLLLAGRRAEALEAYAQLTKDYPDSGQLQEAYAQLLLDEGGRPSLEQALDQWRRVAARSRPQSERWYRAKYSVALALYRLGKKADAASRIRYLLTTPPGLDDIAWKDKFTTLLDQCQ
jgi:tetratricopeptide (TPR) repeat protein